MVWLWTAFKYVLQVLFGTFIQSTVRRLPVVLAGIALIVTVTGAYLLSANSLIAGIQQTIPGIVVDVWGWVMPPNAIPCLTAIVTAQIYRFLYIHYRESIKMKTRALTQ